MNTLGKKIRIGVLALVVALVGFVASVPAFAKDVIHLKDGRTLEGEIVRELASGAIFFKVGPGQLFFQPDEIESIERDPATPPAGADVPNNEAKPAAAIPDGATRIAFISLEEEVGPFFNKDAIEHSLELLDDLPTEQKPSIVVFVIDSGGGGIEFKKIQNYIHEVVQDKYRTVAWIKSAISAAAMAVWGVQELYMKLDGGIGACTGFRMQDGGQAQAIEGDQLEELLVWMEEVSRWGGHDPFIMRAMQVSTLLSATRDENGHVTWYIDEPPSGAEIVSPKKEILTLSAHNAVKWGIAKGIADTKDELAKAMGCAEWVEVGQKADEYQIEFRKNVEEAQVQIQEHWAKLNIAVDFADGAPNKKERQRNVGEARKHLKAMQSWVRRAPSLEEYMNLTPEFFRDMDRRLRDIANKA